jgi:tRNA pseudouridine13 synthase
VIEFNLNFCRAHGAPIREAGFRYEPADFEVEELGIEPEGDGEHLYLLIEKVGQNTHWLAEQLATFLGVKTMDVAYSGKKDRHAVTRQWFSVYLPGGDLEFDQAGFLTQVREGVRVLRLARGRKKLRAGNHTGNYFKILLRDLALDLSLEQRLQDIKQKGVPNYFGEQRFGRDGNNLRLADNWVRGLEQIRNRNLRGIVLSATRSWLFNLVLQQRVSDQTWQRHLEGESEPEASGPMWGRGRSLVSGDILSLENNVLEPYAHWCDFLEHRGLSQERRPLKISLQDFVWRQVDSGLELQFKLATGQFATSVLREITQLNVRQQQKLQAE